MGSNRAGASPFHLRLETDPVSETLCFIIIIIIIIIVLLFRIPYDGQSPETQ
jgi:hypothetical protein